jgi:hypothetical protein
MSLTGSVASLNKWIFLYLVFVFVLILLVTSGCAARRPGEKWPWVTHSEHKDDVIYQGVGFRW